MLQGLTGQVEPLLPGAQPPQAAPAPAPTPEPVLKVDPKKGIKKVTPPPPPQPVTPVAPAPPTPLPSLADVPPGSIPPAINPPLTLAEAESEIEE